MARTSTHNTTKRLPRPNHSLTLMVLMVGFITMASTPAAHAVHPAQWQHTTEADFAAGETDNTVITNLGDVKLGPRLETLAELPASAGVIYDVAATPDGKIFIATGPKASLAVFDGEQATVVLDSPDEQFFCLATAPDGALIVGVSGNPSKIATLKEGKLQTLAVLPDTRYIWDMLIDEQRIMAATGTDGKLLRIDFANTDPDGNPTVTELLDTAQSNLLCIGRDDKGRIYTGTDTDGLIYRVTPQDDGSVRSFVLYDASEPEIGALLVAPDGTIFAGTADANQARPGRLAEAAGSESGRPEVPQTIQQGDTEPGEVPNRPPDPAPVDNQPNTPQAEPTNLPSHVPGQHQVPVKDQPTSQGIAPYASRIKLADEQSPTTQPDHSTEGTQPKTDRLRTLVDSLITETEQADTQPIPESTVTATARVAVGSTHSRPQHNHPSTGQDGNAVYRITPDGYVTEIFRESVMILNLLADPFAPSRILVATGNEGQIFRVNPDAEETTTVADLDPMQAPVILHDSQGRILIATANPATLVQLRQGFSERGTYTSPVLEAPQTSLWGKINITANTPANTTLSIETRTGNVKDPDQAPWSMWTGLRLFEHDPQAESLLPRTVPIHSPPARYFQYRLILTGDLAATPVVDRVGLTYVVPNLKPSVSAIRAAYNETNQNSDDPHPNPVLNITWEAADPNDDKLQYTLQYKADGTEVWFTLDDELTDPTYNWQTRRVPDGWYVLRVTADDQPDNPPDMAKTATRISDPVLIDNTPPVLSATLHKRNAADKVSITVAAKDTLSMIDQVGYALDSANQWQALLPDDLIFDSTTETFTIKISDLAPGPHVVVLRAIDFKGNPGYLSVPIRQ